MLRDIEVQNTPTIVADHEKTIQHTESDRWDREEVHRCDGFSMVTQKGEPTLGRVRIPRRSFHPTGDRMFREIEAKHEQLAMNARCSPGRILSYLFKGVDASLAVLVVILGGVMPAVIYFVNVVNDFAALMVGQGADFLSVFEKPQRDALALVFLRLHSYQVDASLDYVEEGNGVPESFCNGPFSVNLR
jgi:hypothetical protein